MSFLICDPYVAPAELPDSFVISGLGVADTTTGLIPDVTTPATVNSDGSVDLHFDLTNTPDGSYTVTVKASLAGVMSDASASVTFSLPVLVLGVPQNVRVSAV